MGSLSLCINQWNLCLFFSFIICSSCHLHHYSIAVFLNSIKLLPIRLLMWHDKYFLSTAGFVQFIVKGIFGCVAAVACGMLYGIYLSTYHDRKFWFSTRQVGAGILWLCSSYVFDCLSTQILNVTVFFSLKELERELTFQEGSGLYYYYYKYMLTAPSFEQGSVDGLLWLTDMNLTLSNSHSHVVNCFDVMGFSGLLDLILDNKTISGQTINVVQRLSLYPELITSFIYKVTNSQVRLSLMSDELLK